jgi:tRNA 2-thiouridine synthesizing protein C
MVLTTAAFDQQVCVLFVDDGVLQIKDRQNPAVMGLKDTASVFRALEIYDVNTLFVEIESLQARGIEVSDLILPVKTIQRSEISGLMRQYDVIVPD